MDILDFVISGLEDGDEKVFQLNWYNDITQGLSYPTMSYIVNAIKDTSHLLLFYKLLQRDILQRHKDTDAEGTILFMEYYALKSLKDRMLPMDLWDTVRNMSITEFAAEYGIRIPDVETPPTTISRTDIITTEKVPERMPGLMNTEEALSLYRYLQENNFVSPKTSVDSFCYRMGVIGASLVDQRPICWQKNKQLLREMLEECFASLIQNKTITKSKLEKIVPKCFVDRAGMSIKLSKNRHEASIDSDIIAGFFNEKSKKGK